MQTTTSPRTFRVSTDGTGGPAHYLVRAENEGAALLDAIVWGALRSAHEDTKRRTPRARHLVRDYRNGAAMCASHLADAAHWRGVRADRLAKIRAAEERYPGRAERGGRCTWAKEAAAASRSVRFHLSAARRARAAE